MREQITNPEFDQIYPIEDLKYSIRHITPKWVFSLLVFYYVDLIYGCEEFQGSLKYMKYMTFHNKSQITHRYGQVEDRKFNFFFLIFLA